MTFTSGLAIYFVLWWITLFMVLPWGIERDDADVKGAEQGAPKNPNLKKKFVVNTILSAVIWFILFLTFNVFGFSFREAFAG